MRPRYWSLVYVSTVFVAALASPAQAAPIFQMPFPCNETWRVHTYADHNPYQAVDMNVGSGDDDLGRVVVASAAGTVDRKDAGITSYGQYIDINHGGGWITRYAHLDSYIAAEGASVKMGDPIGRVGSTGGTPTMKAHLHYEQRSGGSPVNIKWDGAAVDADPEITMKSKNCPAASDGSPIGSFDLLQRWPGGVRTAGWTIDPDTPNSIPVHIYVGSSGYARTADKYRQDVGAAYPGYGNYHGFDEVVPAATGTHSVCTYGIQSAGGGSNALLGCKSITVSPVPFGSLDTVARSPLTTQVAGWAIDPDTASPIQIRITVDGTTKREVTANVSRPDVASASPGYGDKHGFDEKIVLTPGAHTVCVVAIDSSGGQNKTIGCRNV